MNEGGSWWWLAAALASVACGGTSNAGTSGLGGTGGAPLSAGQAGLADTAGARAVAAGAGPDAGGSPVSNHGGASSAGVGGSSQVTAGQPGASGEPAGGASGESGAGGASGAGGSTDSAQLVPLVNAFCAAARACCAKEKLPVELVNCESLFPTFDPTFVALARGAVTLDQAGLPACLTAYQQAASECLELPVLSACQGLLHRSRKENEKCSNVAECAREPGEAVACVIAESLAIPAYRAKQEGLCAKVPRGKLGDPCQGTCNVGSECSFTSYGLANPSLTDCFERDGLYCSGVTGVCATIAALDAPCTYDGCGSANFCDNTTCKKRSQPGETCTESCLAPQQCINHQCVSPSFTAGNTCSGYWFGPY